MGLYDFTFYDLVNRNAAIYGAGRAWTDDGVARVFSFSEIKEAVDQVACGLQKIGIEAELLDYWNIDLKIGKTDIVHIFNAHVGTYHLAQSLKLYGAKYVVNPIFYNRHTAWKVKSYLALENFSRKILKGIFIRILYNKNYL